MGNSDSKPAKGVLSLDKPDNNEIIIKCSVGEMMKIFFKDYVIVWHDPNVRNSENQKYIAKLELFCEVLTFTEWEKTRDYITTTQAVCHVITSGTNGELLVREIFEYENVCNIYVFCGNKEYHSIWAKKYHKISSIETNIKNLSNQIQQNLLEWYKKASSLNFNLPAFAPIFNDSDKSQMNHLHSYLKIIPNFKNRQQAKQDFLALSKAIYTDPNNQKFIADFQKYYKGYHKDYTLRWYTLESFLYKVTNNCLRIATSDSIQYCRLPLKDIEQAIKDQYRFKSKNFSGLLYRGAYLSEKEWLSLKENQDKEIEMHGFLSVSKEKNIALNFLNIDPSKKALITIIVPKGPNDEEQGFAEMEEYSQFPQEKEILFNVRSRFTVLETEEEYSQDFPCRHLVLLYGAQGFRKSIIERNPAQKVSIPNVENISCVHCNVKSERFFFVSIAGNYYCKGCINYGFGPFLCIPTNLDKSTVEIKGFSLTNTSKEQTPFYGYKCCHCQAKKQKAYFICIDCNGKKFCQNCFEQETLPCLNAKHNLLLETRPYTFWCEKMSANELNHMRFQNDFVEKSDPLFQQAEMYFESHIYEKAQEFYRLYIHQHEATGIQDASVAASYNNLATIHNKQGEYKKALQYYLKALNIREVIHKDNNRHIIAASYNNVGLVYSNQGDYKKALECYLKSLDILKSISANENNPELTNSYTNIGNAYNNLEEYNKALEYYLKALEIDKSVHGENHPHIAHSENNLGGLYCNMKEYTKAFEHFLKSFEIFKSLYGENHPLTATSYINMGEVYSKQGEYTKAIDYGLKGVSIYRSVYGDSHPNIAFSYNNIGEVYYNQGEYNRALEYHLKSLDIYKAFYGENHPDIATADHDIGKVYSKQGENKKAVEFYLKALDIRKSVFGDKHSQTIETQNRISEIQLIDKSRPE